MSTEETPRFTLSVTDRPLGDYVADVRLRIAPVHLDQEPLEGYLTIRDLELLRGHIDNVLDELHRRRVTDAVAGNCTKCKNTRMVSVPRKGHVSPEAIHCPRCAPKLARAREEGLLR